MKAGPLCVLACRWCAMPEFWAWVNSCIQPGDGFQVSSKEDAAEFIKKNCSISSRKDLDLVPSAAMTFGIQIRTPFMAWQAKGGRV